jgi:hypothetical protein
VAQPGSNASGELPFDWFTRLELEMGGRESDLYFSFMERCLEDAGFAWEAPAPLLVPPEWAEVTRYPLRYGVVTLGQAELAAYRAPEELFPGYATEEADKDGFPSNPAERAAALIAWGGDEYELSGDDLVTITDPVSGEAFVALERPAPLGRGCQGQANTWLYGGLPDLDSPSVTANPEVARAWVSTRIRSAFESTLADDRVLAVASQWRACMDTRGWHLSGTWRPGGIVMGTLVDASLSADGLSAPLDQFEQERANTQLAIADVRCQDEVGWLPTLRAVEMEYQQATVERVPQLVTDVRAMLEEYRDRLSTLRLEALDY